MQSSSNIKFIHSESYKDGWPHNHKKGIPTPSELAEAGFFLVGPQDYCRCFQVTYSEMQA